MTRYDAKDWDAAVAALRDADAVTIACHVNPDGDALGSLFGASLGLRTLEKKTFPTWGATPPEIPPGYEFLPGADSLVHPEEVPDNPVFLAVDCGAIDRLGENLVDAARRAPTTINVDHHPGNDEFGDLNVVVPTASSTSELVFRLLQDLDIAVDRDIATNLYTGVFTDTGSFQYANSTPDTLRLAAELLEFGVPKTQIAQHVFETAPYGYLRLLARVLSNASLLADERFIYSVITHDDLRESDVVMEETDKVIDVLRSTRDADVAAIFKEQGDGKFRASLRSKGNISVGAIARARGGGGHELAAGFTTDDIQVTVNEIVEGLKAGKWTASSR
ncbi:MAG: DHH family phosphoesterase [Actinomycetota bacterium]